MSAQKPSASLAAPQSLSVAGIFAGIGGIELGLGNAGHGAELLCELDAGAQAVLRRHFPNARLVEDVADIKRLPRVDVLAAGFPCQDLSQAGGTAGISGTKSSLVDHVLELLERGPTPRWVLLENVSFMLHLDRGVAMDYLTGSLADLGFRWAYRVIDTRAFGLPQRRKRVFLLASKTEDPRPILLQPQAEESRPHFRPGIACGFYWTEGYRGLGWAVDAIPTLKGGSTIGIPSQPAIWMPDDNLALPDIRDGERLQGFPAGWTAPCSIIGTRSRGHRWKLVGNAVSVPVAEWIGRRLAQPDSTYDAGGDVPLDDDERWPDAAWGDADCIYRVDRSTWPIRCGHPPLQDFLTYPTTALSARASAGFLARAKEGPLRFVPGFLAAVEAHVRRMLALKPAA